MRPSGKPQLLTEIEITENSLIDTGISELNRVLGGGIIRGTAVLIGGEPGIGKSTLMLQLSENAETDFSVLYVSGEESPEQIKIRADRLKITGKKLILLCETRLEIILEILREKKPGIVIIDSIQTIFSEEAGMIPGTVNQLRFNGFELISLCKENHTALILLAHVTKEGTIAGPKVLEHMVDTVLHFDNIRADLRCLRAAKNRFGSVDEIGLFTMDETGLKPLSNAAGLFLEKRNGDLPAGTSAAAIYEGSRVLFVEIQALVVPCKGGGARVYSDRIDPIRVNRIAALLEKHAGIRFSDQDIYINVAGGLKITDGAAELALALSLYSARTGLALPAGLISLGEVSLAGEIRQIPHLPKRIKASEEIGFKNIIIPGSGPAGESKSCRTVKTLKECIQQVFGRA